jgi:hypothetical protein
LRYKRTRASFRRSAVSAIPTPMTISASVALKLPGAMQLIQVPMTAGASYMVRVPSTHPVKWDRFGGSQSRIFRSRSIDSTGAGPWARVDIKPEPMVYFRAREGQIWILAIRTRWRGSAWHRRPAHFQDDPGRFARLAPASHRVGCGAEWPGLRI